MTGATDPRLDPANAHPLNAADCERSQARIADIELGLTHPVDGSWWRDRAQQRIQALEEDAAWLGLMPNEEAELEQLKSILTNANERLRPKEGPTPMKEPLVEHVALAMAKEIGWGTFSHFNPDDMRRVARAAIAVLEATRTPEAAQVEIDEPYRTMDENGSPTDAGTVGWNWIGGLARQERERDAVLLVIDSTPVEGGGKVTRLYRGTSLLAVATTFRDDMNFTVLVRWLSPDMRAALAQVRHPSGEQSS